MECYHLSVLWSIWMSLSLIVNAQQEFDIRLSGGDNPREGRVEVFSEGIWGSICDKQWSIADADVVCKQLNLSYAISAPRNAAYGMYGEGQGHVHLWLPMCDGIEDNIRNCTRVIELVPCLHSEDASVVCSDRGQPRAYDVRIVGGSHPSTGQVEIYLNTQWGTLCSYPWSIIEADAVCRQSGYGGALITEGVLPEPLGRKLSLQPSYTGLVNCSKGNASMRGYGHLFGCRNDLVLKQDVKCDNPNTLACTRHQAELPVRLYGGSSQISGRVEVLYGGFWWGICSKKWDLTDANVVCNQLGYNAALNNSATVTYPDGHYGRYYLMSKVNCTGEEMNIGRCARVYGSHECIGGDYSSVTCDTGMIDINEFCTQTKSDGPCKAYIPSYFYNTATMSCESFIYGGCNGNDNRFSSKQECEYLCSERISKDGTLINKHVMIAILVLIPTILLLLFFIAYYFYKKHSREGGHSDTGPGQSSYSPMNQQECIELSHEATEEQNKPIKV